MKKISIIGNGTAGCLTAMHLNKIAPDIEIDWYYDSKITPLAVGEGTTPEVAALLEKSLHFVYEDLLSIDGTVKIGVQKINWGNNSFCYFENVQFGRHALHFNAVSLQKLIQSKLKEFKNIKFIDKNIKSSELDSDYVINCSGFPKDYSEYNVTNMPTNSVYVTQCFWDSPRFINTFNIARPYGWVFCIPLQNRCAVGYVYNKNISTLEEIKEDVLNIFKEYNLTPSKTTNYLEFNSFYRKVNFSERGCYNGTSSFFYEPLEATSLHAALAITEQALRIIYNKAPLEISNTWYSQFTQETEAVILLMYSNGSKFNSPFWQNAKQLGIDSLRKIIKDSEFIEFYNSSKSLTKLPEHKFAYYGTWGEYTMNTNCTNLGLYPIIDNLIKESKLNGY